MNIGLLLLGGVGIMALLMSKKSGGGGAQKPIYAPVTAWAPLLVGCQDLNMDLNARGELAVALFTMTTVSELLALAKSFRSRGFPVAAECCEKKAYLCKNGLPGCTKTAGKGFVTGWQPPPPMVY